MSGYLLIFTVLLLGGAIAVLGDRLGFKVGKAKLSVFGLRPKYTAVVVTLLTGFTVSAVTLGIILLVNNQIRIGLFELDSVLNNLQEAKEEQRIAETEVTAAREQRAKAEQQLVRIQNQLQTVQRQQQAAAARLKTLQAEIKRVQRAAAQSQAKLVGAQAQVKALKLEEAKLLDRQKALITRNTQLAQTLAWSSATYLDLRKKATELVNYGDFIFQAGDVFVTSLVRGGLSNDQQEAALNTLFLQAEQEVRKRGSAPYYGTDRALLIPADLVVELRKSLTTDQSSIVQLIATRNVLRGEPTLVSARVIANNLLFNSGEVVASQELVLPQSESQLRATIEQLFEQASRKARNKGIFPTARGDVGYFPADALEKMMVDLQKYQGTVTLQVNAAQDIYRIGPLSLSVVVLQNGLVIIRAT